MTKLTPGKSHRRRQSKPKPKATDRAIFAHYDATCFECETTIFFSTPVVVRNGWRYHPYCLGYASCKQVAELKRFPLGKDQSDPDARLS